MRIFVAGGAGFIGAHLCLALLRQGHQVICLDNFSTGRHVNIKKLLFHPRFMLLRQDVRDPLMLDVDQIYNLACPASPPHYQKDPIDTFETSVFGTRNLLKLAEMTGARLLQASTSEIYGDPLQHPQSESYWGNVNPIGPRSCYDEGKRAAETMIMDHVRTKRVDACIVRIFNTYGPCMRPDDGRVVSNFICQALANKPITIYGDGEQTRSFCYVGDLVRGLVLAMNRKGLVGPLNLGNPSEFTVRQLADKIVQMTGSKSELVFKPLPTDDPKVRRPNIKRAKEVLGWKPRVKLSSGLRRTISYFKLYVEKNKLILAKKHASRKLSRQSSQSDVSDRPRGSQNIG